MSGAVRSAVTAAGIAGALAPDSSGMGALRFNCRVSRYWLSIIGPLCSIRRPMLSVRRELILISSCTKYPEYEIRGCWMGMVCTLELLSIAPRRNVAHPLPLSAVFGAR
jgi:hypothetical protein